jgi:adenylylsulfate kinase
VSNNIHTTFHQLLKREDKEHFLKQKACVVWLTGLSGSGKTTIAVELERKLLEAKYFSVVLDGDNIRHGINNNLGFSEADRQENIRRIAEIAKLFLNTGIITICCFVSPTKAIRQQARNIIGDKDFIEVFVDTPLEECEKRDVKGLYKKARAGEIKDFTGINQRFEIPENPNLIIQTSNKSVQVCTTELLKYLLNKIKI